MSQAPAPFTPRSVAPPRKPEWLKIRLRTDGSFNEVRSMVQDLKLHTVCQEARCPNIFECFSNRTATFMILGDNCTRRCGFCAVGKGAMLAPDPGQPPHVAEAAAPMGPARAVGARANRERAADARAGPFRGA